MLIATPIHGLVGGATIGLSASTLLLFNGEILGASGIVTSTLFSMPNKTELFKNRWKLALLAGFTITSQLCTYFIEAAPSQASLELSPLRYAIGGLLVGFGTKLGNGCTSGHGICGLARWSKRSLTAVTTFMASSIITVLVNAPKVVVMMEAVTAVPPSPTTAGLALTLSIAAMALTVTGGKLKNYASLFTAAASGALFSVGLAVSGMIHPIKVFGFLNVSGIGHGMWDPTLACVMAGGVLTSWLGYQYKYRRCQASPLCAPAYRVPTNTVIDSDLILGAACFGIGWGAAFLCPGPALFQASLGGIASSSTSSYVLTHWWPAYAVGAYTASIYKGE